MAVTTDTGDGRRRAAFAAILIAIVSLSGWLGYSSITDAHNWGDDFAAFIMQAADVAQGRVGTSTTMTRYAIEHSTRLVGPAAAPWGAPLLLAPVYAAFGLDFLALKCVNLAAFVLFLLLLGAGPFSGLSLTLRIAAAGLFAFNPAMMNQIDNIGSDVPFLVLSTLAMTLMDRIIVRRRTIVSPAVDRVTLGLVMAMAWFVRTNGVLILLTILVVQGLELLRRGRAERTPVRLHVLPIATFAVAAVISSRFFADDNANFGSTLAFSVKSVVANVGYYALLIADFFEGVPHRNIAYLASLAPLAAGMIRLRRTAWPALIYSALTFGLFVVLPFQQGLRYLLPVLPFYAVFVVAGLEWPAERFAGLRRVGARVLVLVPIAVAIGFMTWQGVKDATINLRMNRSLFYGVSTPAANSMFRFIREQTRESDIIVFFKPRAMMLMTGRRSIIVHEPEALDRGDYLCVYLGPSEERQIPTGAIREGIRNGSLTPVHSYSPLVLFRIERGR